MPKKRNYHQSPHTGNLFKSREEARKKEKRSFGKMILFFIIIIVILALIYWLFFSTCWQIKKIEVKGTDRVEEIEKIENLTQQIFEHKRFFILPQKNIFILSGGALSKIIEHNFDLKEIELNKKFPSTLEIRIEKNLPILIWQNNDKFYRVFESGEVKDEIFDLQSYELPRASFATSTQIILGDKIIDPQEAMFVNDIFSIFNFYFKNNRIERFEFEENNQQEVKVFTQAGWYLILNTQFDAQATLEKIKMVIEQNIEKENKTFRYIDARIKNKIFYK